MDVDKEVVRTAVAGSSVAHLVRPGCTFTLCGRIAGRWWRGRASKSCQRCVIEAGIAGLSIPRQGV